MKSIKYFFQAIAQARNFWAYKLEAGFARPVLIYLNLTGNCNFRCQNCDMWKNKNDADLKLSDWRKILLNLKKLQPNLTVNISGGEPLLYRNFWALSDLLREMDIIANINTNGSLINANLAKKIIQKQFGKVEVSFYSLKPELQNALRDNANAFESAYNAIKYLLAEKKAQGNSQTKIMVAFLLTNKNIGEAVEFIKYFNSLGVWVSLQSLDANIQPFKEKNYFQLNEEDLIESELWPANKQEVKRVFLEIINLKKSDYLVYNRPSQLRLMERYYLEDFNTVKKLPCMCGQNNLIVSPEGDVFFCFRGPIVGNLLRQDVKTIWQSRGAKKIRKDIKKCRGLCRIMNCNYQNGIFRKLLEKFLN